MVYSGGFNGIQTQDLCDAGALLYLLSYEANQFGGQFVGLIIIIIIIIIIIYISRVK